MLGRVICVVLAVAVWLLIPHVSHAQSFNQSLYYQIQAHHSGKCLDVRDVSVSNGGRLQQWDCASWAQKNQMWMVVPTGGGTYRVASANSAKCADVINSSTANGTYVQQWDCNLAWAQWNQSFNVLASPNGGYWRLTPSNASGAKCLDVEGVSTSNGANIQLWDCGPSANTNQDWTFVPYITRTPLTNLQFFGYYFSGSFSGPSGIHTAWDLSRDHANLADAYAPGDVPSPSSEPAMKARLLVHFLNYAPKKGNDIWATASDDGGLLPDYQTRWAQMKAQMGANAQEVAMFYISDEPYWQFDSYPGGSGFSHAEIAQMLDLVATMIKQDFPNAATAVVEGWPSVYAGAAYPASIDYVGFDYYNCETGCNPSYSQLFNSLKANLQPNQKLLLAPIASVHRDASNSSTPVSQAEQDSLIGKADFYVNLAMSEPRVGAFLVWTGETVGPNTDLTIGAFDIPAVKAKWQFMMRALGFGTP
jgi:hypothetical protein